MANINLLPWREEAREKQKRDYTGVLALVFLVSGLIVYLSLMAIDVISDDQKGRNAYLQSEIQLLEAQIAEITEIRTRKKDIERRTEIILGLQQSRNLPTHVLDELVRIVPAGIYLSSIEKKGSMLWIEGRSESNNNVANMMRKVKTSNWLQDPNMQSIIAQNEELRQLQRFTLRVTIADSEIADLSMTKGASK
ncbi:MULTISPECIES: PilN domain-containing protein [unclassified Shewanella]|jgi:type IV pilus assembly protein PilN|uniref:PilN domain-containing protein n=1 Tax=unclassified Shewanella TaxID=196818 RepID=UPI000C7A1B57|nr:MULTISPECIES: PilN domain-containing protein [unclassified Shewanella]PKG57591.1 fimbrial protein [Shewanella sp. GutDb-MelDb]PKG75600.1 fimbrial protein [Shewanella sp. GutCb]